MAHLVIAHPDADMVALHRGRLPSVPAGRIFEAAHLLGIDPGVVVVRPLARFDDDRVVACELMGNADALSAGLKWVTIDAATEIEPFGWVIAEWAAEETDGLSRSRSAWFNRGWLAEALAWATEIAADRGRIVVGPPVQLRHWGLSAVFSAPTDSGEDLVVKEVPPSLRAEGPLTAWLGLRCPGAVPAVLGLDERTGRFVMDAFASGDAVGAQDVVALADLQQSVSGRGDELLALGLPDFRMRGLIEAAEKLTERVDLLLCDTWSLAATDTRRPPRPMTSEDIEELQMLVPELMERGERVAALLPDGGLVHGDFHIQNVAAAAGAICIFDWGHAAVGLPGLDLPAWPTWAERSDEGVGPYLQRWVPAERVASVWTDMEPIALLFHAVVAARLADAMDDPSRRADWAAGAQKLLLGTLSAAKG